MAGLQKLHHRRRTGLIIQALQQNSSSVVLLNIQLGEFFKTTVGICQESLLSSILFNLFPEKIMQETLRDHHTFIPIGGRPRGNLRDADDFDFVGGSSGDRHDLTNRLVSRATAYRMEVSSEKRKIMTSSTNDTSEYISMNGQKLVEVTSFKYLGATRYKDGIC